MADGQTEGWNSYLDRAKERKKENFPTYFHRYVIILYNLVVFFMISMIYVNYYIRGGGIELWKFFSVWQDRRDSWSLGKDYTTENKRTRLKLMALIFTYIFSFSSLL